MGIDNDLLRMLYDFLLKEICETAAERTVLQDGMFTKDLSVDYKGFPRQFKPECVISDMTSDVIAAIMNPSPTTRPEINPKLVWLMAEEVQQHQAANIKSLLAMPYFSAIDRWIFLIDTPSDVTRVKGPEHEKRSLTGNQPAGVPANAAASASIVQRTEAAAYTDSQLKLQQILVERHVGGADGLAVLQVSPTFGQKAIHGWHLPSLWKTSKLKPIIGKFFMENVITALRTRVIPAVESVAGIELIVDGAWPGRGYFCSPCFQTNRRITSDDFVSTSYRSVGEVDLKLTSYLNATFGRSFLIRSDDSDYQPIILLHFIKTLMISRARGVHFNHPLGGEKRRPYYTSTLGVEDLPEVWIDRTVNFLVRKNPDNPHRFVNVKCLLQFIALYFGVNYEGRTQAHADEMNAKDQSSQLLRKFNKIDAMQVEALHRLSNRIVGVVFIMMIRKTDFTESLEEAFPQTKGKGSNATATADSSEDVNEAAAQMYAGAAAQISGPIIKNGKPAKQAGTAAAKAKPQRASGKFSIARLVERLFPCDEFYHCFKVDLDNKNGKLVFLINAEKLQEVIFRELELNKVHRCDTQKFKKAIKRFEWVLNYWSNQNSRVANEYLEADNDGEVPAHFHGLEVDPVTGNSIHGWRLIPAGPTDNPNATHIFSFTDRALEAKLFPASTRRTNRSIDAGDGDVDYDRSAPSSVFYRVSIA